MAFASAVTLRLDVPEQPGQWVVIKKLGWKKLRDASEAQSLNAYAMFKALGKDGLEAVRNVSSDQIREFKANPSAGFDASTLLRAAVTSWSLSDKPTPEQLDDLSEEFAAWLVEEIIKLAKPPRDEQTVKND